MKVKNANGKEFDVSDIPDIWQTYLMLKDTDNEKAADELQVLRHQAHAMRDTIKELTK